MKTFGEYLAESVEHKTHTIKFNGVATDKIKWLKAFANIDGLVKRFNTIERDNIDNYEVVEYDDKYQYFIAEIGDLHDTRVSNYVIARLNDSKTDYYGFDGDGTEYDFSETNIKERLCSLKPIK